MDVNAGSGPRCCGERSPLSCSAAASFSQSPRSVASGYALSSSSFLARTRKGAWCGARCAGIAHVSCARVQTCMCVHVCRSAHGLRVSARLCAHAQATRSEGAITHALTSPANKIGSGGCRSFVCSILIFTCSRRPALLARNKGHLQRVGLRGEALFFVAMSTIPRPSVLSRTGSLFVRVHSVGAGL